MRARVAVPVLAGLGAALLATIVTAFHTSFEAGGIYPSYSTLRKDPDGTSILFESLRRVKPETARNYLPLVTLAGTGHALLFIGVHPNQLSKGGPFDRARLEALAGTGNRVVVAFRSGLSTGDKLFQALEDAWGLKVQDVGIQDASLIDFRAGPTWRVLSGTQEHATVLERTVGAGAIVLAATSDVFLNGTLAKSPETSLLASIMGTPDNILFDESHLGIEEAGSVMGLLRAYRLQGVLLGLMVPLALFAWRSATSFPPARDTAPAARIDGRGSMSGLFALLQRNISARHLGATCWEEWLKGKPRALTAERATRVREELVNSSQQPLSALKNMYNIVNRKRTD